MNHSHQAQFKRLGTLPKHAQRVRETMEQYFKGRTGAGVNAVARYAVLRPVATLLIASMVSLSLQPLVATAQVKETGTIPPQIAQWLPKTRAALSIAESRTVSGDASVAATNGRTSALLAVEELLKRHVPNAFPGPTWMKRSSATAGDRPKSNIDKPTSPSALANAADQIVAQLDAIRTETRDAQAQFAADRTQIMASGTLNQSSMATSLLLLRHAETVAEFDRRANEFERLGTALSAAQAAYRSSQPIGDGDASPAANALTTAMNELATFVAKYPNQRAHQFTDPNNLPFRLAKSEVRAPIEDEVELAKLLQAKRTEGETAAHGVTLGTTKYKLLRDDARRVDRISSNPAKLDSLKIATTKALNTSVAAAAAIIPPAAADLSENEDVQITQAIRDKAAELKYSPLQIYNWVRNTVEYLPTYGSIQGSDMTLLTKRGNAFDTASLTIALLRASGIPAKYVYGTVEIPSEQVQNWVGNVKTPEAAQSLLSQGGIPNVGVVSGGKIAAFRFEHVWVEAFVDYYPSRGATHVGDPAASISNGNVTKGTTGDTWVPFDSSFKQFAYTAPLDVVGLAGIDINGMRSAASAGATVDPSGGWVSGIDSAGFARSFENAQHQALGYLAKSKPDATLADLLGGRAVIREDFPVFAGTLRSVVKVVAMRSSELSPELRWKLDVAYYASETSLQLDSPSVQAALNLSRVNVHRLGVKPVPATQSDADLLAALAAQQATQLTPYAIRVIPQLQLDGTRVVDAPPQQMGDTVYWALTISGPGQAPRRAEYKLNTGDEIVFGLNAIGMDPAQHQLRHARFAEVTASNNLQQVALAYWAQHDIYDELLAKATGQATQRMPSAGVFAARLNVRYFFGVARTGYYQGRSMDVKQNLRANAGGTPDQSVKAAIESGIHGSYLEGFTFDVLFNRERGTGISATNIIQSLQTQGAKIYKIDASNLDAALPSIQTTEAVKADIANAVAAGQYAIIGDREISRGGWSGAGYYLIDPTTGAGAYLIDGGYAGGDEGGDCQMRPVTVPGSEPTNGSLFEGLFWALALFLLAVIAIEACIAALPVCGAGAGAAAFSAASSGQTPSGSPVSPLSPSSQQVWDVTLKGRQWPNNAPGFDRTPEKPFGNCGEQQWKDLQNEKDATCNPKGGRSCSAQSDCTEKLQQKTEANQGCITARLNLMDTCFGGGDAKHWDEVRTVLSTLSNCLTCMAKRTGDGQTCKP